VILLLAAIGGAAAWWCFERGYTLYFGDAEAHLNIARRVFDSRTPGPYQIGTVWLPLPHAVLIPFVMRDLWWRSGLAGVFPSVACFVLAGAFLFAAARRDGSPGAALATALLFTLNPNILYWQATPMTELLFIASLLAMLWATLWFRDSQSLLAILVAAAASNAASLTRYEGWFLIPFAWAYLLFVAIRRGHAMLFAVLAALGPLAWLAHNQYYYSNALEFYNGPYSAGAIYQRQLAQGMTPYPGDHQWLPAARYYFAAARLVAGDPMVAGGGVLWKLRRSWWPMPCYRCLRRSMSEHAFSSTPIFVPTCRRLAFTTRGMPSWWSCRRRCGRWRGRCYLRFQVAGAFVLARELHRMGLQRLPSICWKESEVTRPAGTDCAGGWISGREYRRFGHCISVWRSDRGLRWAASRCAST
jgi:hypothetical protein